MRAGRFFVFGCLTLAACAKVPYLDTEAAFDTANAAWFEEEETLFFFYNLHAAQGLGQESVVEISYRTDDVEQEWARVPDLAPVHTHVPVSCGPNTICGSTSLHVAKVPRAVGIRLRYHYDGEVTLDAPVGLNVIAAGPPDSNRSFIVYGVFDEGNARVQWRGRHQIPSLRNQEVEALGLRRRFSVAGQMHGVLPAQDMSPVFPDDPSVPDVPNVPDVPGEVPPGWRQAVPPAQTVPASNYYYYGFAPTCPAELALTGVSDPSETEERAIFNPESFPLSVSASPGICAQSTVFDAKGAFSTVAVARRNPDVRPAFPTLRSPIHENTAIRLLLAPCQSTVSSEHKDMQKQRLEIGGDTEFCLDDWSAPSFVDRLVGELRQRIDTVRAGGRDMVLSLALHHDDRTGGVANAVESALAIVLLPESTKSSPRATGAFVFDSRAHEIANPELKRLVLWCPANLPDADLESIPDTSQRSCPVVPDNPSLKLGPFSFTVLPILPSQRVYLDFLKKYSERNAGRMRKLTFLGPEHTPISEDVSLGDFGAATFFNNEIISAAPEDAFSYCTEENSTPPPAVFRAALTPTPMPLSALPAYHEATPEASYALGLYWEFPFLLRLEYEVALAGAASAFSATVPFGLAMTSESYYGAELWSRGEFPLTNVLLQCTRFCLHPTFDSAGVYNVLQEFRSTYRDNCYRPRFPSPADGGFPLDP